MGVGVWLDGGEGGEVRGEGDGPRSSMQAVLAALSRRRRELRRAAWAEGGLVVALLAAMGTVLVRMLYRAAGHRDVNDLVTWALMIALYGSLQALARLGRNRGDEPVIGCIAQLNEPSATGLLVDAAAMAWPPSIRTALWSKVAELLPQLTPAERAALTPQHYRTLRARLAPGGDPTYRPDEKERALVRTILEFMAESGHLDVQQELNLLSEPWRHPEVRAEARKCRDRLLQVQADAQRSGTLLRPADAPGETLLRPAEPAPEEQLLRAVDGEAE